MNPPNPALVSERAAATLPRAALLVLCAAYVLPGLFGRDPWKSADITAFGYIFAIAQSQTSWLMPTVGGLPADGALLPYWIGAVFVKLLGAWLDPAFAARVPFALLLALALSLTWYATYHLARSESAQPLPFAFGGEAAPTDYARAIADGAVLALIASLGLLQLGHETTPELVQLAGVALYLYALSIVGYRPRTGGAWAALSLLALAASGAPAISMLLALLGAGLVRLRHPSVAAAAVPLTFLLAGAALAAAAATVLGAWAHRLVATHSFAQALGMARSIAWFAWPAWLLALWTLWRWRRSLTTPHIALPLGCCAALLLVWIAMAGADRALMLALPALAVLAAFALPTLQRGAAAAIDWFSVFFFSIAATTAWVFYVAIHTGTPAKLAANVAKLSPGYTRDYSLPALVFAVAATLAWVWLVRWRTRRSRHALWKSLVLPAGGVSLCWLLVMTLLLPPLDNARSYRSMVQRIARQVPPDACVAAPGMPRPQVVALEYLGGWRVDAVTPESKTRCGYLLLARPQGKAPAEWQFLGRERRNRNDEDVTDIYRRISPG